jgi:putative phosphoesterase
MDIAIISDSHNNWDNLELAVTIANQDECEALLFAGDLAVPAGMERLADFAGPVYYIIGNAEDSYKELKNKAAKSDNIHYHSEEFEGQLGDTSVYMHHYPDEAEAAAESGAYDLCVHGHTHEFRDEEIDGTRVINPGVMQGMRGRVGFAIYDTESDSVEEITLAY